MTTERETLRDEAIYCATRSRTRLEKYDDPRSAAVWATLAIAYSTLAAAAPFEVPLSPPAPLYRPEQWDSAHAYFVSQGRWPEPWPEAKDG